MNFTIVTAVSKGYEEKLLLTVPTWKIKPQFADKPMILFTHGIPNPEKTFGSIWKDIKIIQWNMAKYDTIRELMLSSFVIGTSEYVETSHWIKIDSDTFFTNDMNIFDASDFNYDLVGNSWGYTRPLSFIQNLQEWAEFNHIPGNRIEFGQPIINPDKPDKTKYKHSRISSFICLHKSDFVREANSYLSDKKLPIPSHDTFLWYLAERLPNRTWKRKKIKHFGVVTKSKISIIRSIINSVYIKKQQ